MIDDELLSIGAFSVLVGLSVPALRHYDDVNVLKPRMVDPSTSYRYYSRDQVHLARVVRAFRRVDLPIDELREVVRQDEPNRLREALMTHRSVSPNVLTCYRSSWQNSTDSSTKEP